MRKAKSTTGTGNATEKQFVKKNRYILPAVIASLIIVVFLVGNIKVPCQRTEMYNEEVPYTITETFYETVPKIKLIPVSYQLISALKSSGSKGWGIFAPKTYWYYLHVKIRNTDDVGGIFKVSYIINKDDGGTLTEQQEKYIAPYQEQTITAGPYKFDIGSWYSQINSPTKEKLVNEQVAKQKDVIKTKTVTKERTINGYKRLFGSYCRKW